MWKFDGLPLHPLVVHAPVVLIPLVAAGLVLFVLRPETRRVLGPVLALLAVGAALTAILAVETGQQLADELQRGDTVDTHKSRGELVRTVSIIIAVAVSLVVGLDRSEAEEVRRWAPPGAAAVTVLSVFGVVMVGLAGHSGAQLAWEAKFPSAAPAGSDVPGPTPDPATAEPDGEQSVAEPTPPEPSAAEATPTPTPGDASPVIDVVLGEWAVITSVTEAPPGPTTFRIRNAGELTHSFRIRSAGSGRDRLEWRSKTIPPGGEITWTVDLPVGNYDFDCPIEDEFGEHDELGMEIPFTIREGAPPPIPTAAPVAPDPPAGEDPGDPATPDAPPGAVAMDIEAFAFSQPELRIPAGTEVTWTNRDPAPHTATGDGFDTGTLSTGQSGSARFDTPGTFPYICTIHPSMTATIVVEG